MSHDQQHVIVSGLATPEKTDSIVADLNDVDVAYVLNLVNFHSVDFTGKASGKAIIKSLFNDLMTYAQLDVKGVYLRKRTARCAPCWCQLQQELEQIDIHAVADDGPEHQTLINGYVSPKRNYIDWVSMPRAPA